LFAPTRFHRRRPSPFVRRVGSCIARFGACSAFTRVTACMLTESPYDPLHRRLQRLRYLYRCFDCYRAERTSSRAGLSPAVDQRLFTAHAQFWAQQGTKSDTVISGAWTLAWFWPGAKTCICLRDSVKSRSLSKHPRRASARLAVWRGPRELRLPAFRAPSELH
jgi:hypothetical protein